MRKPSLLRKSRREPRHFRKQPLAFPKPELGHSCPQRCPSPDERALAPSPDPLGAPLDIKAAARLIGCSPWTVRQKYLPLGIPHHRASPNGKLLFYKTQLIRWLLARQDKSRKKGGNP